MASFFSKYPKLLYNTQTVTDILSRIALRKDYSTQVGMYYPYTTQENDTLESIAFKYYGDAEKHWIVLLMNNIIDPIFDFALTSVQFNNYIETKYSSYVDTANGQSGLMYAYSTLMTAPFSYKVVINSSDELNETETITEFYIDEKTYNDNNQQNDSINFSIPLKYINVSDENGTQKILTVTQEKKSVSIFDYEYAKNEEKRNIILLRQEFANQFEQEFKSLMSLSYV